MTMDAVKQSANYHDLASLDELRSSAQKDPNKALNQVASQFEAMFMQMLLKQMRKSNALFENDSPLNNRHTQTYRDMHDNQMALELSSSGALGLADLIVAQLNPAAANMTPASVLRGGQNIDLEQRALDAKSSVGKEIAVSTSVTAAVKETLDKVSINRDSLEKPQQVDAAKGQSFATPSEFIETLLPIAKKWAVDKGIEPMAIVAQAALESGWGKKVIANNDGTSSHNLFGIKADKRWQGDKAVVNTLEYRDGQAKQERAAFRSYDSFEESVKDYLSFVEGPRYQQAVANGMDAKRYAAELQNAGYATDPQYANKIGQILDSRHFSDFRRSDVEGE
ncbi:flagellar assembly peptidoglycan hydrolase FlgJ [Agarivorans sp. MS3-6]|uniref:flagellar assembly peptidoglycan hydrolase FlgJ n=1 Tax=Agarivorans sp. TSD2052 TaxID=2937286 RepID=UPI0020105CEC|nr:flagellar assembly peptidoglycan hydrolase FlgJ [Agarivorans sp. TSD2052]UPW20152.1 flagellar assembly peptidoglycan hydrolase FlgJ [Agarivorans sp. TSD2052]